MTIHDVDSSNVKSAKTIGFFYKANGGAACRGLSSVEMASNERGKTSVSDRSKPRRKSTISKKEKL